jgi:UDP-2,3-diacylglucosamine pyrophosphatase LpxH
MHSIFVSDLHLCPTRPAINATFREFLQGPAAGAEALYILGDLFEYWAGDDQCFGVNVSSRSHRRRCATFSDARQPRLFDRRGLRARDRR